MTVVSALSPLSLTCFFYDSGELVRPARLFFYKPNTEDAVTIYTDPTLGVPYGQPVLSGGSGRVPPIYIGTEPYRVRIYDTYGALIEDIEFLPGATAAVEGGGGGTAVPGAALQTGDFILAFANHTPRTGCVRANGNYIGNLTAASPGVGLVERFNADTHDLFVWLWGQDRGVGENVLPVYPSKGASSAADWAADKSIALPDLRARALVGLDAMGGAPVTNRLLNVPITGWVTYPGSNGGLATTTQTFEQMPTHGHGLTGDQNAFVTVNSGPPGKSVFTYNGVGPYTLTTPGAGGDFVDITHTHTITQTPHVHEVPAVGGGAAMSTISPFALACIYIKL